MTIENVAHIHQARNVIRRANPRNLAAQQFERAIRRYPGGVKITLWGVRVAVSKAKLRALFLAYVAQIRKGDSKLPLKLRGLQWAGLRRMAAAADMHINTARRAREALRLLGLLDWLSGAGGGDDGLNPCLYRVIYSPDVAGQPWPEGESTGEIIAGLKAGKKRKARRRRNAPAERAEIRRWIKTAALNGAVAIHPETGEILALLQWPHGTVENFDGPMVGPHVLERTGSCRAPAPQQLFFSGMEPVARARGKKRVIHRPGVNKSGSDSSLQGARTASVAADPGA